MVGVGRAWIESDSEPDLWPAVSAGPGNPAGLGRGHPGPPELQHLLHPRPIAPRPAGDGAKDGFSTVESSISVSGTISDSNPCTLEVNGRTVLSGPGSFSTRVELSPGANTIRLAAKDVAGNERTLTLRGTRAVPEPPARPSEREGGWAAFVAAAGVAGMAVLVAAWTLLRGPLRVGK